ncbi:MAG: thioredoxin domain-containing protein, partial [Desulfobacterales bacterium]
MDQSNYHIVRCVECGAANRIPAEKTGKVARCGKCRTALPTDQKKTVAGEAVRLRCTECGTKNKIPAAKIDAGARCGRCGVALRTEELYVPQPLMITDSNFEHKVMKSPLPVLLFAWAPWCPTCGAVTPIIDEFAAQAK